MKRVLILLLSLILSIYSINAIGTLEVSFPAEPVAVEPGSQISFEVALTNTQTRTDELYLVVDELSVSPNSKFVSAVDVEDLITLASRETKKVLIKASILPSAPQNQNFKIKLTLKSRLNDDLSKDIELNGFIVSPRESIEVIPKVSEKIIPGRTVPFSVELKNKGNFLIEDAELLITSRIFSDSRKVSFFPKENKTEDFVFDLEAETPSGEYPLNFRIYKGADIKGSAVIEVYVEENPDIQEKKDVVESFLKAETVITTKNYGNSSVNRKVTHSMPIFKSWFTKVEPKGEMEDNLMVWKFSLKPGEENKIKIVTNYRPFTFFFILSIIVIGILIYIFRRGVHISKKIFKVKDMRGTSELKILLHVKNRDSYEKLHVRVVDLLPNLVNMTNDFGTLKPSKIHKESGGTKLVWEIERLEPSEERILSYKVRTGMNVVGFITLPNASITYTDKGKTITRKSRRLTFNVKK